MNSYNRNAPSILAAHQEEAWSTASMAAPGDRVDMAVLGGLRRLPPLLHNMNHDNPQAVATPLVHIVQTTPCSLQTRWRNYLKTLLKLVRSMFASYIGMLRKFLQTVFVWPMWPSQKEGTLLKRCLRTVFFCFMYQQRDGGFTNPLPGAQLLVKERFRLQLRNRWCNGDGRWQSEDCYFNYSSFWLVIATLRRHVSGPNFISLQFSSCALQITAGRQASFRC